MFFSKGTYGLHESFDVKQSGFRFRSRDSATQQNGKVHSEDQRKITLFAA